MQPLPVVLAVHRHAADQDVRVAGRILGRRLDRDIDAALERLEVMDAPGVVHHHFCPTRMRRLGDRRDVLHFEGVAAGAFRIDDRGVRPHQCSNAVAVDLRVVEGGFDSELLQHALCEVARRAVDRVRHQHVITRFQERQQRRGHRGQAGADDGAARAALHFSDHVLQRPMRRAAAEPVGQHPLPAHAAQPPALGDRRIQHGGAAQQRRIHEAVRALVRASRMRQPGTETELRKILGHVSSSPPACRRARPIRSMIHRTPRPPADRPGAGRA